MEGKVSWSEEVKPLSHSCQDEERILFCRLPLIWEEAVAFPHLLFDRTRNLAPSVFEVCNVDVDAFLKRATFLFFPFPGVPLLVSPAFWDLPLKGLRRMLFWPCDNRDADLCGDLDLVVV